MRLPKRLIAPICIVAAVVGVRSYADELVPTPTSAVQSAAAQVSAAAAPVTATTAMPAPPGPAPRPTPADRKRALEFGFRPGVVNGIPVFCKEVPIEGTRFTNKRCVREDQFPALLTQLQIARDAAMKNHCNGTAVCGNTQNMPVIPRMSMGSK